MRKRAEDADGAMPGPWHTSDDVLYQLLYTDGDERLTVFDCHSCGYATDAVKGFRGGYGCVGTCEEVASYLASWPPSMAIAVAALLDDTAGHVEYTKQASGDDVEHALAVARAYLDPTDSVAASETATA